MTNYFICRLNKLINEPKENWIQSGVEPGSLACRARALPQLSSVSLINLCRWQKKYFFIMKQATWRVQIHTTLKAMINNVKYFESANLAQNRSHSCDI